MTEADAKGAAPPIGCACEHAEAGHAQFETQGLGCDETEGRYADVTLERCRRCGRRWLRYLVEHEARSGSGRWARGLIDDDAARNVTLQTAAAYLDGLDWYLYGGSYFGGNSGRRSGPMPWG
jgi:hypothetical protein